MSEPATASTEHPSLYASMVRPTGVNGRLYASPDVFRAEMEKIWEQQWVYLGHDSQIRKAGDYFCRRVGRHSLVVSRAADRNIHVLYNRCAHRGNTVCLEDRGNAGSFRCIYHGWNFGHDGELKYVPYRNGYDPEFDMGAHGLKKVACVETHRGFIFARLSSNGVTLREHLGRTWQYIEDFVDLAPAGTVDLSRGSLKTHVRGNWKMVYENVCDGYHPPQLHRSVFTASPRDGLEIDGAFGDKSYIVTRDLGGGHIMLDFGDLNRRIGGSTFDVGGAIPAKAMEDYAQSLVSSLGVKRAQELLSRGLSNVGVFPNLGMLFQDVRVIEPISVDESIIYNFPALLDGAPDEINQWRMLQEMRGYGPGGAVGPDDHEIYERTQMAMSADQDHWLYLGRGIRREVIDADGTVASRASDETAQRAFWKHYVALMSGTQG